ncbi:MAG: hypothetical protein ACHREM_11355 [Polyangiales bacterium]
MRRALAIVLCCQACATPAPSSTTTDHAFEFVFDTPAAGTEDYVCAPVPVPVEDLFDPIVAISWDAPAGAVELHHATLYATTNAATASRGADCEAISTTASVAHSIDVWVGGGALDLEPDVALVVPTGTVGLLVQAHVLRTGDGAAGVARLHVTTSRSSPAHLAAWTGFGAPVPALRPHMTDTSNTTCTVSRDVHVVAAWPHMHRLGTSIDLEIQHASATSTLVSVTPWSFADQPTYTVDRDLSTGDSVTLHCVWNNDSDGYVFPGPLSSDEMCAAGLVAWPAPADWLECP